MRKILDQEKTAMKTVFIIAVVGMMVLLAGVPALSLLFSV